MDTMNTEIRPLGAELAGIRELSFEEINAVSGGASKTLKSKATFNDGEADGEIEFTIDF